MSPHFTPGLSTRLPHFTPHLFAFLLGLRASFASFVPFVVKRFWFWLTLSADLLIAASSTLAQFSPRRKHETVHRSSFLRCKNPAGTSQKRKFALAALCKEHGFRLPST
jgi:hypothetical protein